KVDDIVEKREQDGRTHARSGHRDGRRAGASVLYHDGGWRRTIDHELRCRLPARTLVNTHAPPGRLGNGAALRGAVRHALDQRLWPAKSPTDWAPNRSAA